MCAGEAAHAHTRPLLGADGAEEGQRGEHQDERAGARGRSEDAQPVGRPPLPPLLRAPGLPLPVHPPGQQGSPVLHAVLRPTGPEPAEAWPTPRAKAVSAF